MKSKLLGLGLLVLGFAAMHYGWGWGAIAPFLMGAGAAVLVRG